MNCKKVMNIVNELLSEIKKLEKILMQFFENVSI